MDRERSETRSAASSGETFGRGPSRRTPTMKEIEQEEEELRMDSRNASPFTTGSATGLGVQPRSLRCVVGSHWFDMVTGFIIVVNSVVIGLEQSFRKEGGHQDALTVIGWLEHFFLGVYIVELALRLAGFGRECLRDNWVRFDVLLVIMGVTTTWVLEPIFGQDRGELAPLMVIRTMRLLRLARMVRLLVKFEVLWMLVRGLLNSAGTMFYTLMLLVIILYVFSAVGIEVITNSPYASGPEADEEFQRIANQYFDSLPSAMLTLMQFVCMDSIGVIYRPLIEKDGTLAIYFATIILVIPIVVMNLVTAVIVNGALEQALQDKEAAKVFEERKKARLIKKLRLVFLRLDDDNSGQVSREELEAISDEDKALICETVNVTDPMEIFSALDVDGSGQISIDEFCDGIWQVVASNSPLEVQRMEKQVAVIFQRLKEVEATHSAMQEIVDEIIKVQEATQALVPGASLGPGGGPGGAPPGAAAAESCEAAPEGNCVAAVATGVGRGASTASLKKAALEGDCVAAVATGVSRGASAASLKKAALEGDRVSAVATGVSRGGSAASLKKAALEGDCVSAVATGVSRGGSAASLKKVSDRVACEPSYQEHIAESTGGTEDEGSAPYCRTSSRMSGAQLQPIEDLDLVDTLPELLRAGTNALEGAPAWAQELLAELKGLSLEMAEPPFPSGTPAAQRLQQSTTFEDEDHPELAGGLGLRAPMGPPESATPLLLRHKAPDVHPAFQTSPLP